MSISTASRSLAAAITIVGSILAAGVGNADVALTIKYEALRKMLYQHVFIDGGRHYLQGSRSTPCTYAFLSDPKISARDKRLVMVANFDAQAGVLVNGECVGLGDKFPVTLTGIPVYQKGVLRLAEMMMHVPDEVYADLVRNFVQGPFAQKLRYPLLAEMQNMLADLNANSPYRVNLTELQAATITLGPEVMTLHVDANVSVE